MEGFTDSIECLVTSLTSGLMGPDHVAFLTDLVKRLKAYEQRKYLDAVFAFVVKHFLPAYVDQRENIFMPKSMQVSGVASLFHALVKDNEALKHHLVSVLVRSTIPSLVESIGVRRSVIAALAEDEG
jgi:telomere length regulation protein